MNLLKKVIEIIGSGQPYTFEIQPEPMKKIILVCFVALIALSSCSFETFQCPAYSHHNKRTKHGHKAQTKYHKHKSAKRPSLI
jgi:hypothetical protein